MTPYRVEVSAAAEADLLEIAEYIAERASLGTAESYVSRILAFCQKLEFTPHRGTARTDIGLGMRTVGFERRATILFQVLEQEQRVIVAGVFFAGRQVGM